MENYVVQPRGFNNTHSDKHPLSAEHIKLYHRSQLTGPGVAILDSAIRMDVQPTKVASQVNNQFAKFLTAKDIQNRRQKIEGISIHVQSNRSLLYLILFRFICFRVVGNQQNFTHTQF